MKMAIALASLAILVGPAAVAEPARVAHGDSAGFNSALSDLGFRCDTSGAGETSCLFRGSEGGMMAVTMNTLGMFSVVFAGGGMESASVAEAYRGMASTLQFGTGALADRFADAAEISPFCAEAGYVGNGEDAGWCDLTVVYSAAGDELVQNVTVEVMASLDANAVDRATVNAAVDQAPLLPGVYLAVRESASAPRMTAIAWLPTEGFVQDAE